MNLLRSLSDRQKIAIVTILLLITSSLWAWERYEHLVDIERQSESYQKLYEENQLLNDEIDNLREQNQSLYEVLELKRQLE